MAVDLSVNFAGIHFKNPIIAASGPPTRSLEAVKKALKAGAAGVVPKTIMNEESVWTRPYPIYYRLNWRTIESKSLEGRIPPESSMVGRDILCAYPPREFMPKIREMIRIAKDYNAHIVGSVMGGDIAEWVDLSRMMEDSGVAMLELDLSCPSSHLHSERLGRGALELSQSPEAISELVESVKKAISIPTICKINYQTNDPCMIAAKVKESGGDALTMFNILHGLSIDIDNAKAIQGVGYVSGVYSGVWATPLVLKWIAKTAATVDIPISGSYGIQGWRKTVEFLMAGARTIQVCSAIMAVGYGIITEILEGLHQFMEEKRYQSMEELIGAALPSIIPSYKEYFPVQPLFSSAIDSSRCDICTRCAKVCFYDAIRFVRVQGEEKRHAAQVDEARCIGCGACVQVCPREAIYQKEGNKETYLKALKLD